MGKINLFTLISALYLLEIQGRAEQIKNAAKENGVNEGELFKALKEAGYNPKAEKGSAAPEDKGGTPPDQGEEKKEQPLQGTISVLLRHKTEYPQYRRAGLVLKQTPAEFYVTAEQLAVLKKDKWIEVKEKCPLFCP
ncbi:MAG: hypothetical protein LBV17_09395 [Treponema sp.]|jgi:hypothetical protein|nr:hypothetical protein [Treponema sp.]